MATVAKATTTATTTTMLATSGAASEPATNATATATTTPPQALDLATLLTRQQIQHHLSLLTAHEQQLDARLQHLISPVTRQTRLITQLRALDSLSQVVGGIEMEAQVMRAKVADVADTAERVGGTVRKLDLEQSRVKQSIEFVSETQELKQSIAALDQAIQRQDWETATRYMQRATTNVSPEVLNSAFAEAVVPTSDLPQSPPSTLAALRATLLDTFTTAFKSAAAQQDTQNINRFFKLFPMIGEDDTGLKVYAEWVGGIVRDRCGSAGMSAAGGKATSPTQFSSALTTLFETLALIIAQHESVVVKYYGRRKIDRVAAALVHESDEIGARVMERWRDERDIKRVKDEVRLAMASGSGVNASATAMATSATDDNLDPRRIDALLAEMALMSGRWQLLRRFLYDRLGAGADDEEDDAQQTATNAAGASGNAPSQAQAQAQAAKRGSMIIQSDEPPLFPVTEPPAAASKTKTKTKTLAAGSKLDGAAAQKVVEAEDAGNEEEEDPDPPLEMVEQSELGLTIAKELRNTYAPLEVWYLRSTIEKAHAMDELDPLSSPSLSSSLDDVFYILKKTLYRLISTSDVDVLAVSAKDIRAVVEKDVAEVWRRRLENAFNRESGANASGSGTSGGVGSGATAVLGNLNLGASVNAQALSAAGASVVAGAMSGGGGRAREEEKERREREARGTFIIYLNNLDTAAEYTVRLIDETLAAEQLENAFFRSKERERARIALVHVRGVEDKFRSVLKSGLDHLFNQLVRPRLRPLLSEVYKDVSYVLDEDAYNESEYRDEVRKRFVKLWEGLLSGYKESLTGNNFNLFFATAVNVLVRPWEGMIRGMKFTELGALRLDRDIRSILSYLSTQSPFASGSLRESFSRLQQIATLLTLDSPDEADEVLAASGNRLTASEVKSIWQMRV